MLIGVVSDTHLRKSDNRFFYLVKKYFSDCDLIIHAGDIVDIEIFDGIEKEIIAVKGNMDIGINLPSKRVLELENMRIGVVHGYGSPQGIQKRVIGEFEKVDCIVFGHTHFPMVEKVNGILLFNPGSAFDGRYGYKSSIGYLEIVNGLLKTRIEEFT